MYSIFTWNSVFLFVLLLNAFGVNLVIAVIVLVLEQFNISCQIKWSPFFRAKLINRSDDEELFQIVDELSYSAGIDPPKFCNEFKCP